MVAIKKYGWIRDLPDHRDIKFSLPDHLGDAALPPVVDLRSKCPPVYDQGQLGSCTANAIAGALEFDQMRQSLPTATPSRLFIYWNERDLENTTASDSGAQIRDGIKSVAQWGDCPETEWPYDISQFATQPPANCYSIAAKHLALVYQSLDQALSVFESCLAAGFPFVFGFTVHRSFESAGVAKTGIVPMPGWFDPPVGGHAVMAVGYNNSTQEFVVRNSWGSSWGDGGYFYFPYAYMLGSLASDFWVIRTVE